MSLLNVTSIQNPAAPQVNISLNADGSVTLPVYTASAAPALFQAGTLWFNTTGPALQIRNPANTAWLAIGGGGGGTYTATAPIVVTGTIISLSQGLGLGSNGTNLAFKMPVAATPPAIGTGTTQAFDGSMYWDDTLGQLFIRYNNAGTPTWVTAAPPAGGVPAASLAEAAAGVTTAKYSSPATAVAKDAANTTGAALIPAGTTLQQPASPVAGMLRMNTTLNPDSLEVYDGTATAWKQLAYTPDLGPLTDLIPTTGSTLPAAGTYENIIINAGVTVNIPSTCFLTARTSIQINGTINANGVIKFGGRGDPIIANSATGGISGQGLGVSGNTYGFATSFISSGASSGSAVTGNLTSATSAPGGNGGGTVIFNCQGPITVGSTGIIQAEGGVAGTPFAVAPFNFAASGAGGGSGGLIILQSLSSLTLSAGAQLTVKGGNGGNGSFSGTFNQGGGGGGGGGGYIVLNSPSTTDASTKSLTGGLGGSTATTASGTPGIVGAGFGGAGGSGSTTAAAGAAGSPGLVIINAYV